MLHVEAIARGLADEKATVTKVALTLGRLGERRDAYFKVGVEDAHVESAHIGMAAGGGAESPPEYVELYFREAPRVGLAEAVPFCREWKLKPTNAKASPWHYACTYSGSTAAIQVMLFASLTGELGHPEAHVRTLLLQRSDWR